MVDIHLGVNSGRDPGEQHPDENRRTPSAVKETRADREKKGYMSDISAHRVEDAAKIGLSARHSRELSIRRVDNAVKNEKGESDEAEAFVVEKGAGPHADQGADNRQPSRSNSQGTSAARDNGTERPEKINVGQLLDLDRFEGETLRKNWMAVAGRHKAVRCTPFPGRCKSRSGGLQTAVLFRPAACKPPLLEAGRRAILKPRLSRG